MCVCVRALGIFCGKIFFVLKKIVFKVVMDLFFGHCLEFLHVKPGKGAAFVRTTLRNYVTGNQVEKTFRAGRKVITLDLLDFVVLFPIISRN